MNNFVNIIGNHSVPMVITAVGIILLASKKDLFSEFLAGAREGLETSLDMLPTLVILVTAVKMITASGAVTTICEFMEAPLELIGVPSEILPTLIMRPISGSAATATVKELFEVSGTDSFAGRCASVIMGSSDTIIYTLAMYFGAVKVKNTRHALPAAFLTMAFCTAVSVILTKLFFGVG